MGQDLILSRQPASDQLHPLVYKLAAGFVLCFVVAAWVFFARQYDIGELLVVASGLLLVAVLLPAILWRVWRREQESASGEDAPFRHWASGEFTVGEGQLKGSHAAIDALLPLAAVACGMIGIGIVFAVVAATAP